MSGYALRFLGVVGWCAHGFMCAHRRSFANSAAEPLLGTAAYVSSTA